VIAGHCDPRFHEVRNAYDEVMRDQPVGSALAVWYDGRFIVDLRAGSRTLGKDDPWTPDTLVMPYSVSKPLAAVALLRLVARGVVDLDAPARTYWPELACTATVRQLLAHSAGLVALDDPAPTSAFFDWTDMCARIARQEPKWEPGTAVGEAGLLYGYLLGEIVRRVDGRSLGTLFRDEVAAPHGFEIHIGVPESELSRVADLVFAPGVPRPGGGELRTAALGNPPGFTDPRLINSREWRMAEIAAVNAHVTARAVAGFFAALANGQILPGDLVTELGAVQASGVDRVVGGHKTWGLGVLVEDDGWGMGGTGGSLGWWSVEGSYALGFVTAYVDDFDRVDRVENALRATLGLRPLVDQDSP
jgi:CubicO group peptidase (beta-lactamase class C family)